MCIEHMLCKKEPISMILVREQLVCLFSFCQLFFVNLICLQVCKAYESNLEAATYSSQKEVTKAKEDLIVRQRAWCKRKSNEGKWTWRPAKRNRVSACHWAMNVDNQIKHTLGFEGLKAFVPKAQQSWKTWKHMNVAIDQGGDGLAACNFLLSLGCCLTIWCDFSHGANNDVNAAIKEMGLWSFWLLMLVTLNVPHGPWDDDVRHAQTKEGWDEVKENYSSRSAVLFQHHLPNMIDELQPLLDQTDFNGPLEDQIWKMTNEEPRLKRKGNKSEQA